MTTRQHALGPAALAISVLLFAPTGSAAQAVSDGGAEGGLDWSRLEGHWSLEDGRSLVVTDLLDQMPDGRHQLMAVEPESGWVRTLYPADGEPLAFEIGAGYFQARPAESRIVFRPGADALQWVDADGREISGTRSGVRERAIRFESNGIELAGSLLLPQDSAAAPYPALVFIHGSGPLTRRSPRQVGYLMAASGVAAVVFDKRGTGESGGSFRLNAVNDAAHDAIAALDFARTVPELDPTRIGIHAASEGGYVAPAVIEERPDIAAFICRVCPIFPWAEALPHRIRGQLEGAGLPQAEVANAVEFVRTQVRFALHGGADVHEELVRRYESARGSAWLNALGLQPPNPPDAPSWNTFREFLAPDPTRLYSEIEAPVLVVLGESDTRLPGGVHGDRARALLGGGRSPDWEVRVLPDANHGLMLVRRGPDGAALAPTRYAPDVQPLLVDWAKRALRR